MTMNDDDNGYDDDDNDYDDDNEICYLFCRKKNIIIILQ